MRWLASMIALMACVEPAPPRDAVWLQPVAGGWAVRWTGDPISIDGRVRVSAPVHLSDARAHAINGARIPPRERDPRAKVRFIVLGDGRAAVDGVGPSAYWPGMLNEALAREPAFILNTGDLVKNGRDRAEWDPYLRSLPIWPPILSVRGNHDRGPHFAALGAGVGQRFDWRWGAVRVLGLDSEAPDAEMVAQLRWLDMALSREHARWTIVMLHRPIYSRGNHGSDERGVNAQLVPILERHAVDLVFSGHDHDYERFCPIRAEHCDPTGVTYIVTGGAATFTVPIPGLSRKVSSAEKARDARLSRHFSGAHHFVEVEIDGDHAVITARATRTGNLRRAGVLDRVELER